MTVPLLYRCTRNRLILRGWLDLAPFYFPQADQSGLIALTSSKPVLSATASGVVSRREGQTRGLIDAYGFKCALICVSRYEVRLVFFT